MNTDKIARILRYISGIPKSIYVNFRLLPFRQAVHLPIMVSRKTKLQSLSGKVYLGRVKMGIIRIGFGGTDMLDYRYSRSIIKITGEVHFRGKAKIAAGAKLHISGELHVGENLNISGDAMIVCAKKISIGNNVMIAWQSIIMDTDQHNIYDKNDTCINENKEIIIGNSVWIGARSFILKGSVVEDGSIIGANTTITKSFCDTSKNSIIAGNPVRVIKREIRWQS